MARILGLDLGSWSIKGLWLDSSQKGASGRVWLEVRRRRTEDPREGLRAALDELLAALPPGGTDQVVVSLPGPALATHQLSLPFTDSRRIEATLPFELEGLLPKDLDDVAYDYQLLGRPRENGSDLLVGVVAKEELDALLELLAELKLDPRIVTHPAVVYQNLFALTPPVLAPVGADELVAIVDIGHTRTNVAMGVPGGPMEGARTFGGGGADLTRLLAGEFQIGEEDAAAWKEQHGALGAHASGPDGERAASALARGLQPMLRELRPTLRATASRTHKRLGRVYLCGATAQLPGLGEHLSRELGVPVEQLSLPNELGQATGLAEGHLPAAGQAYALVQRGLLPAARAPRFNFRRGGRAFRGDFDFLKDRMGLLAAFAATLLLLFVASGLVQNALLKRREAQVDDALCELTKRTLGTCERDYARALNLMGGKESVASAIPSQTATQLLAEIVARLPSDQEITLDRVEIALDRVSLRGTTTSRAAVDDMSSALQGYRCFRQVDTGRVETAPNNRTSFRLDIEVACPNDEAAPQG